MAILLLAVIQVKIWRLVQIGSGQVIIGTPFTSASTFMALAVASAFGLVVLVVRLILDLANRTPRAC